MLKPLLLNGYRNIEVPKFVRYRSRLVHFRTIIESNLNYFYALFPIRMKRLIKIATWFILSTIFSVGSYAQALSDTIDVVHYEIHLDVLNLPAKTLSGKAGVEFTVKLPSQQSISLELINLLVDSVKSSTGEQLTFIRTGDRIQIMLPTAMNPADTSLIWIWYHGIPFSESWGGFHFSSNYAFNLGVGFQSIPHNLGKAWFPCVDDFKDRAFYDYFIRVDESHKAVCGGLLQSVNQNGDGTHTFHWQTNRSIPTYLASVAVGPYELISDVFNGIEADIPVTYYVRPSDTARVRGSFVNMKNIAAAYESKFGPYPFSRIGITGTNLGAMEHSENIAYPHSSISGNTDSEWLYAHELSHMWFGDKVTCSSAEDMWLNEGWARWCEILFTELLYGQEAGEEYFNDLHYSVLMNAHIIDDGYRALSPMPQEYTYGSTVYDKGSLVVHTLRHYMGDSLFFNGVQNYLTEYAFNDADSYDLRSALENSSGMNLEDFFDFFVFSPGFTHYSVDSFNLISSCGSYRAVVYMKQKLRGTTAIGNNCRADLSFMDSGGNIETYQVNFSGVSDSVTVLISFKPVLVMVDLYHHLADATTDEAMTLTATGTYDFKNTFCKINVTQIADSAFARVTHNWVAPDSLKIPQPGLAISSNHYWTIEGIFPPSFNARGIFTYNKNTFDGDIITNKNDSLVILYRPGTANDWMPVDFIQTGPWQIGTLTVDYLQPGQYTLAVWDELYVGSRENLKNHKLLHIFPNPAKETLTIQTNYNKPSSLLIYDSTGKQVHQKRIEINERAYWSGKPGTYVVALFDDHRMIDSTKVVIQ